MKRINEVNELEDGEIDEAMIDRIQALIQKELKEQSINELLYSCKQRILQKRFVSANEIAMKNSNRYNEIMILLGCITYTGSYPSLAHGITVVADSSRDRVISAVINHLYTGTTNQHKLIEDLSDSIESIQKLMHMIIGDDYESPVDVQLELSQSIIIGQIPFCSRGHVIITKHRSRIIDNDRMRVLILAAIYILQRDLDKINVTIINTKMFVTEDLCLSRTQAFTLIQEVRL